MGDLRQMNRRTLLKRAGLLGAALVAGGVVADRAFLKDDPSLPYLPGFNDDFALLSTSAVAAEVMPKLRAAGGRCARIGVDWSQVQAAGPTSWDWSSIDPVRVQALLAGVQILPTLFGCPEWAKPVATATRRSGPGPSLPDPAFRTCSPEHDPAFGRFAAETIRHFDLPRTLEDLPPLIPGVEIFNEPNLWKFGDVPPDRTLQLTQAAAEAVAQDAAEGRFSGEMRVITGGLAPAVELKPDNRSGYPARPAWQDYLAELDGPGDFDVGFHSYELSKPPEEVLTEPEDNPDDPAARARQFAAWQADQIVGKIDEALALTERDLWLTETGASSEGTWSGDVFTAAYRLEHGQQVQADVLSRVADALKSRSRCRSMIVHRLFSADEAEPPPTPGEDSPYYGYGVYDAPEGPAKLAVTALADSWN